MIDLIFQAHFEGRGHDFAARNTPDHPPLEAHPSTTDLTVFIRDVPQAP